MRHLSISVRGTAAAFSGRRMCNQTSMIVPCVQFRCNRARGAAFRGYRGRLKLEESDTVADVAELSTIRVQTDTGASVLTPETLTTFEQMEENVPHPLSEALRKWRHQQGYQTPTDIQKVVWPLSMSGRDLCCVAPTSSGKTLAYLIPILAKAINDRMGTAGEQEGVDERRKAAVAAASTCSDCGLLMVGPQRAPMCLATGAPHPPASLVNETTVARMMRLQDEKGDLAPKAIILAPTVLLCAQIERMCAQIQCGVNIGMFAKKSDREKVIDMEERAKQSDIIVTTPGSLMPAIGNERLSLRNCSTLVLDEVDSLLSQRAFEVTAPILKKFRQEQNQRETRFDANVGFRGKMQQMQVAAFSASLSEPLYDVVKKYVLKKGYRKIIANVSERGRTAASRSLSVSNRIVHNVYMVGPKLRLDKLRWLHESGMVPQTQKLVIFCNSRENVDWLSNEIPDICQRPVIILSSRSDLESQQRAFQMHNKRAAEWMVCTDVAARGIDFHDVWVLNWDMPHDIETFIHRSGRTGRHRNYGMCFTFFLPSDVKHARALVDLLREQQQQIPSRLAEYARQNPLQHFVSNTKYVSRHAINEVRETKYTSPVHSNSILKPPRDFVKN